VKVKNKLDQHSESKHQQGPVRLQEQQGRELKQLKQEQQQRASVRAQVEATAGWSAQGGAGQHSSPAAGGGASASDNQGAQQQQGEPHNSGSTSAPCVKLEPVDLDVLDDVLRGVAVGTAVRRKFPGYGWYDGVVRRTRSAGTSVEYEVERQDGSRAWIKQGDAQKYEARYAQGARAGAGAGANRGAGSGASGSF
jgi:hypothetical protein